MKKVIIILLVLCCCKPYDEQDTKSLAKPDDEVKIAINYIGDDNCTDAFIKQRNTGMNDHKLDGKNGELIVEEYKDVKNNQNLTLSGDNFLSTNNIEIERSIDAIEANCRRLILSIDADGPPTIVVTSGSIPQDQKTRFESDFSEFKPFVCEDNFCTSNGIKEGKRHFAYIETDNKSTFSAKLTYTHDSTEKNNTPITLKDVAPRTVASEIINRCFTPLAISHTPEVDNVFGSYQAKTNCQQKLVIYTNSKDYLRTNNFRCAKGTKGLAILIGNNERIASDCTTDKFITLTLGDKALKITASEQDSGDPETTLTFDQKGNPADN